MWLDDISIRTHRMASGSPLALDLNGDGVHTVDVSQGVHFDLYANGRPVQAGWVDRHDGLLALDLDGNGHIDSGAELFGNHTALRGGGQAADGWAALAQHDANHDGQIDAQDAVFGQLRVWQDANGNAVADAGELSSLAERGIVRIDLQADEQAVAQNGNVLRNFSRYTTADGVQHEMVDAWFRTLAESSSLGTPDSLATWVNQASAAQTVELSGNGTADVKDIRLSDVLAAPQQTLVVKADAQDVVRLDQTGWTATGTSTTVNHHSYELWSNSAGARLLIDQQAQVQAVL